MPGDELAKIANQAEHLRHLEDKYRTIKGTLRKVNAALDDRQAAEDAVAAALTRAAMDEGVEMTPLGIAVIAVRALLGDEEASPNARPTSPDNVRANAARPSVDGEDGEPCPECGHPFGTPPDPLAPTCRYCQVPSPSAASGEGGEG